MYTGGGGHYENNCGGMTTGGPEPVDEVPQELANIRLANGETIGSLAKKNPNIRIPLCCFRNRNCCRKAGGVTIGL